MNLDPGKLGDHLAELLAALDTELAQWGASAVGAEPDLAEDQLDLYRLARESLVRLETAWPREGGAEPCSGRATGLRGDLLTGSGRLGKFQLHRELGRGGSGIVFLATDTSSGRDVALKLPRLEALVDGELRQRFLREAKLTIGLVHPGLVRVYEADEIGAICYVASAYGGDMTLASWLASRRDLVPLRTAAALTAAVADAADFLHEHHILHRDVKPSNILLDTTGAASSLPDPELANSVPRLTDFGLATLMDASLEASRSGTLEGSVIGTAEYMPPEQAEGHRASLGRASDVYALGAILYEMLTGHAPFRGRNTFDTLRKVLSEEPEPPRRYRKSVPRRLEAICLKCLEKQPRRRYATAQQLAEDLRRFLAGQRTVARPRTCFGKLWSWGRRRPTAFRALTAGTLLICSLVTWMGYRLYYNAAGAATLERKLERAWGTYARAADRWDSGDAGSALLLFTRALADAPDSAVDLQELLRVNLDAWALRQPALTGILGHPNRVIGVRFSPDGLRAVTVCIDGSVRVWDAGTGLCLATMPHPVVALDARFTELGQVVQTVARDGRLRWWSANDGRLLHDRLLGDKARKLTTEELLWEFTLGDTAGAAPVAAGTISELRAGPGGDTAATLSYGGPCRLWKISAGSSPQLQAQLPGSCRDAAFSPDGQTLATAGNGRYLRFWDLASLGESGVPIEHPSAVRSVSFSGDGRLLATGDGDAVRIWDAGSRELAWKLGQLGLVTSLTFSDDGRRLASGCGDTTVRLWALPPTTSPLRHPLHESAGDPGLRRKHSAEIGNNDGILALACHPDGRTLFASGVDDAVRVWQGEPKCCTRMMARHLKAVLRLAVSPDGRILATGGRDGVTRFWDIHTGTEAAEPVSLGGWVNAVDFSRDGRWLATGTLGRSPIRIWDRDTGDCRCEGPDLDSVFDLAFSPDGCYLLVGAQNRAYVKRLGYDRDLDLPHRGEVFTVAYGPSGLFITGTSQGELSWWDASTAERLAVIQAHSHRLRKAIFSPSGALVVTTGADEKLCFWHVPTRCRVGPAVVLRSAGQALAYRPDETVVFAGCSDGSIYQMTSPRRRAGSPAELGLWSEVVTGLELTPGQVARTLDAAEWAHKAEELRKYKKSQPLPANP